jgi:poly-gamma-glutamate capsule biosynthesis protein CapA/YwtB (metallophosphatase superfamily)
MSRLKLIAVGDISLQTRNGRHPFGKVKEILEDKDILFGNLETVLSNQGKPAEKAIALHTSPDKVKSLAEAGFDVLNLANNHIMDLGPEGFHNTLATLRQEGLDFVGANDRAGPTHIVLEKQGISLGFLGFYLGGLNRPKERIWIDRIERADVIKGIKALKAKCDFVIVSLHWGTENVFYPSPEQIELAHELIDAGAIAILGHHPHVIQGVEQYGQGLIAYSLGNFQLNLERPKNSMVVCLEFTKKRLERHQLIPVIMDEDFTPAPDHETGQETLELVASLSEPIQNGTITERWWFEQIAREYLSGNFNSFIIRIKRYGLKHLLSCVLWFISPFCLRCYAAIVRQRLRKLWSRA